MADFNNSGYRGGGGGRTGILILAIAAIPLVYKACKPALKRIGEELSKIGEKLQKEGAEVASEVAAEVAAEPVVAPPTTKTQGTPKAATPPKETMESKTTKTGKKVADVPITTASPAGHEEMSQAHAAEATSTTNPPVKKATKKAAAQKEPVGDQPQNPKKTRPTKKA